MLIMLSSLLSDFFYYFVHNVRYMFYLVSPKETSFPDVNLVPRLVVEMFPFFILISLLENLVRFLSGRSISRMNDTVASLSQGIFQECLRIKVRSIEVLVYCYVYDNFRIYALPWDSAWTWWICLVFIDFGFYCAHRLAHEVNFIWAIHQAHHSAEDFTMPSALRQALLQPFTAWMTYVPLALFIPPPIFLAHLQLGELYMFWLHTETIPKLGPLEYILNTPSHHRVHHGRNPKYIDKNYGGVFIVWDFMFGSFEPEDPEEPPVYGLVHPVQSYNPFYLQLHHWGAIFNKMYQTPSWKDKLLTPIMGPGWDSGKPRLGYNHEIPKIEYPVVLWDPPMNLLEKAYVLWHLPIVIVFYHELTLRHAVLTQFTVTCAIVALLFSISCVGFIMEKRWFAPMLELVRCLAFFGVEQLLIPVMDSTEYFGSYRLFVLRGLRLTYLASAVACAVVSLSRLSVKLTNHLSKSKLSSKFNNEKQLKAH